MIMFCAARIEPRLARRANRATIEIFGYRQLVAAASTQHSLLIELPDRPDFSSMVLNFGVTFKTGKPTSATFEFDGDDIEA